MDAQQIVTLNLTLQQVNVVLSALSKLPLEQVIDTFAAVREQAGKQVDPPKPNSGTIIMREGEP